MRIQRWSSETEAPVANDNQETTYVGRRTLAEGLLRRKGSGASDVGADAATLVQRAQGSSGVELPEGLRSRFEGSLGADLGGVRVHTGAASAEAAASVGARAYALGQDVHFGAGEYTPGTSSGDQLIAHEVAHTVQQGDSVGGGAQFALEVSQPGDAFETEADRAAASMVTGQPAEVSRGSAGVSRAIIQRSAPAPATTAAPSATAAPAASGEPQTSAQPGGLTQDECEDLREMARDRMVASLVPFHDACLRVKAALQKKAKMKAEIAALMLDVAMGVLIPGFGAFSGSLFSKVAAELSPTAKEFAKRMDADLAKATVTGLTKTGVSVIKNNTQLFEDTEAETFLKHLFTEGTRINQEGREKLSAEDPVGLIGAMAAYDTSVTNTDTYYVSLDRILGLYADQVESQGEETQAFPFLVTTETTFCALVYRADTDALELALVKKQEIDSPLSHSGKYLFVEWVAPEVADAAKDKTKEVTGQEPQVLPTPMIDGVP